MFGNSPVICIVRLSELRGSFERTVFREGCARADISLLEQTGPSQEGSSEQQEWLKRATLWKGFARADMSSLERTTSNQEGSSEERWRLKRTMFCEGFA